MYLFIIAFVFHIHVIDHLFVQYQLFVHSFLSFCMKKVIPLQERAIFEKCSIKCSGVFNCNSPPPPTHTHPSIHTHRNIVKTFLSHFLINCQIYEAMVEDKGKNFIFLRLSAKCVSDLKLVADEHLHAQVNNECIYFDLLIYSSIHRYAVDPKVWQ